MAQKVDSHCRHCTASFTDADDASAHEEAMGHEVNYGAAYTPVDDLSDERRREAYRNTEPRTRRERLSEGHPRSADY